MSLRTNIENAMVRIGTEFKTVRTMISGSGTGTLTGLQTTDKSSLVGAINEVRGSAGAKVLSDLTDVTVTLPAASQILVYDGATSKWVNSDGTTLFQPLDPELTALANQPNTSFGRSLLALSDTAALTGQVRTASTTATGVAELATSAETIAGTDSARVVTPSGVAAAIAGKADTNSLSAVALSGSAADLTGVLPTSALPALAINDTFVVATQAAMLALTAQRGDMAIRTDTSKTYVLSVDAPTVLGNWVEITASGAVTSVAGRTGSVILTKSDVGLASVDNTSDAAKPVSTAQQSALNAKEPTIAAGNASQYWRGDKAWATLNSGSVGLSNVDNTSDAAKPVSTATLTALNGKQALDSDLTAIAALASAADRLPYATGASTWALATFTATGRSLVSAASVAAVRTTIDVHSRVEIGEVETDFAAVFTGALA